MTVAADKTIAPDMTIATDTAAIIARVRAEGDRALVALARELDGVALETLEVPVGGEITPALRQAMQRTIRNLRTAHEAFTPKAVEVETEPGVIVGRRPDPLTRVGVYAPGGRATYPSSLLMGAIPARVAGVQEVIVCSPRPSAALLAAAEMAGVDRVFAVGGAGAIAAMAYGTETIPRVDKIVGPGNAYVAEAKLQLAGVVASEAPAGPSELLVIADESADPSVIAREVEAQAEHDPRSRVAVVVVGRDVASIDDAIAFANAWAPEHLLLAVADPMAVFARIRNAGAVFLGETSSVTFGDYMTGGNHVLPTGGWARSCSGLSTQDFVRWTSYTRVDRAAAARLAVDTAAFAEAEGLGKHAQAARAWELGEAELRSTDQSSGAKRRIDVRRSRDAYRVVQLYANERPPCPIDLSDNTNLWGMPPHASAAAAAAAQIATRYPGVYARELKSAIADYLGVTPDMVVTGCGSDDVLDSAFRALAEPGERVAYADPTFPMTATFARMNALVPVPVPTELSSAWDVDPAALLATGARITYVCSPNNPNGRSASRASVEAIVSESRGYVVIDEAYAEFADRSDVDLLASSDSLVITRTLSKAFGLAGLRVGYAVGSPSVIAEIEKSRGPYKVSRVAECASIAALTEDRPWVAEHVALVRENRQRFRAEVNSLETDANFVFVPLPNAAEVAQRLRISGIAVRAFDGGIRVTIGPWNLVQKCIDAIGSL